MVRSPTLVAGLLLTSLATAQRTWIVGPGGDYSDLPPAVASARDGDTIRVRPGTYSPGSVTSSAVTILADQGATISLNASPAGLRIAGLPSNKTVVVKGLAATYWPLQQQATFLEIDGCLGRVHCDRLTANLIFTSSHATAGQPVVVTSSAHVTFQQCNFAGLTGMRATDSTVVLGQTMVRGRDACFHPRGCLFPSGIGAVVSGGKLIIAASQILGGAGAYFESFGLPPATALTATNTLITVTGISRLAAGASTVVSDVHAVTGSGGDLTWDPRVLLVPRGNALPISPSIPSRTLRWSAIVNAMGDGPGGKLTFDLLATNGDLSEVWLSLPGYAWPTPFPPVGPLWIDPATWIVLGRFGIGASEHIAFSVPVPSVPGLRGIPIVLQAITGTASGIRFSTPATVVLD